MFSTIFLCALLFGTTVESLQTIRHSDHLDVMHQPGYIVILAGVDLLVWCVTFRCIGGYTFHQRTSVDVGRLKRQPKFESPTCFGANQEHATDDICEQPSDNGIQMSNVNPKRKLSKISRNQDIKNVSLRPVSSRNDLVSRRLFFGDPRLEISNLARDITPCFILIVTCSMVYLIDQEEYPNAPKYVDPLMALTTIAFLISSSIPLMKKTAFILLQSLPEEMENVDVLVKDLRDTFSPHVVSLHEFHVWCLVPSKIYATLHIVFKDEDSYMLSQSSINAFLLKYGINNATIQPEFLNNPKIKSPECLHKHINKKTSANGRDELEILNSESLIAEDLMDNICYYSCPEDNCLKKRCCLSKEEISSIL